MEEVKWMEEWTEINYHVREKYRSSTLSLSLLNNLFYFDKINYFSRKRTTRYLVQVRKCIFLVRDESRNPPRLREVFDDQTWESKSIEWSISVFAILYYFRFRHRVNRYLFQRNEVSSNSFHSLVILSRWYTALIGRKEIVYDVEALPCITVSSLST